MFTTYVRICIVLVIFIFLHFSDIRTQQAEGEWLSAE
jgi:hypothetical protein